MRIDVARRIHSRVSRTAMSLGACFVLVAMSVPMAPSARAASAPETTGAVDAPSSASLSNKPAPTEVPSLRTATSNTFDNHDGTFTAQISAGPINYLDPTSKTYRYDARAHRRWQGPLAGCQGREPGRGRLGERSRRPRELRHRPRHRGLAPCPRREPERIGLRGFRTVCGLLQWSGGQRVGRSAEHRSGSRRHQHRSLDVRAVRCRRPDPPPPRRARRSPSLLTRAV